MGMFDTVYLPCVKCGALVGFQSKSGGCTLAEYTLPTAPAEVLGGLTDKSYNTQCKTCKAYLEVEVHATAWTKQVGPKPGDHYTSVSGPPESEEI